MPDIVMIVMYACCVKSSYSACTCLSLLSRFPKAQDFTGESSSRKCVLRGSCKPDRRNSACGSTSPRGFGLYSANSAVAAKERLPFLLRLGDELSISQCLACSDISRGALATGSPNGAKFPDRHVAVKALSKTAWHCTELKSVELIASPNKKS